MHSLSVELRRTGKYKNGKITGKKLFVLIGCRLWYADQDEIVYNAMTRCLRFRNKDAAASL